MEENEKIDFESDSLEPVKKEKIGFSSDPNENPNDKKNKNKQKFKSVNKRTPLRRLCVFNLVIATLLSWTTMMYLFLPFFNGLLIIMIVFILGTIIIASIAFTAGIILVSEGYRNWIGSCWSIVEWLSDVNSNLTKLDIYFPYFAIPAIGLNALTILIAIAGRIKEKKGYITYIVFVTINLIICSLFLFFYSANGNKIFS